MRMVVPFTGGFGWLELVWLFVTIAFWVVVAIFIVLAIRWLIRADRSSRLGPPPGPPPAGTLPPAMPPAATPPPGTPGATPAWGPAPRPDDPLEILRQRYARGEIDDEEYERRRRTLSAG